MSDEEKESKRRKRLKLFLFTIPVIMMVIIGVMLVALKVVERYPVPLRQGFEQYLSNVTGTNATISELEEIKFFPNIVFKAKNITFHNGANAAQIDLEVEEINYQAPFLSVFVGAGKFNEFSLKNVNSIAGFMGPKSIQIETAIVVNESQDGEEGEKESFILANGEVDGKPAEIKIDIEAEKYNYRLPKNIKFSLTVGEYGVESALNRNLNSVTFNDLVFFKNETKALPKTYYLFENGEYKNNNPLYCLIMIEDLNECDKYLEVKE